MAPVLTFLVALTVTQNTKKDFLNAKVVAPSWRRNAHVLFKYLPKNDYLRALVFMAFGWIVFPLLILAVFSILKITQLEYSMYVLYKGLYCGFMAIWVDLFARIAILGDLETPTDPKYESNLASIKRHKVPGWFQDAKLGIFIHWGLYSVPAYAHVDDRIISEIAQQEGIEEQFKKTPYAEWYLNTMKIEGSSTQKFHNKTYGPAFSYDDFIPQFNTAIKQWNPDEWAEEFKQCGAQYVVLTTKHCDGYLLWPSKHPNPNKSNYTADRDIVGELTTAIQSKGMKMGFYYISCWDWTFNLKPIKDIISFLTNGPTSKAYRNYVYSHWIELIDRYNPSILWSDIGYPPGANVNEIFAHFYNQNPEGVVNDRWIQTSALFQKIIQIQPFSAIIKLISKKYVKEFQTNALAPPHFDFTTPEYKSFDEIQETKWETCRGIGRSFGYNKAEPEENYLSTEQLIHLLIDIVSKNGNLLLNIGPNADGSISEIQKDRLKGLGKWLSVNGEAIYGTKPWERAEGKAKEGVGIRFTQKENSIYAILLGTSQEKELGIRSLAIPPNAKLSWLGASRNLTWAKLDNDIIITVPDNLPVSEAHVIKIELPLD
ncbi:MAG: alpha-L-fucosidase [Promethearchaeota archaeon]|nr:MAG: alpha-L-fucosidase [Candidatus Lokiarchaeota archaeon]